MYQYVYKYQKMFRRTELILALKSSPRAGMVVDLGFLRVIARVLAGVLAAVAWIPRLTVDPNILNGVFPALPGLFKRVNIRVFSQNGTVVGGFVKDMS